MELVMNQPHTSFKKIKIGSESTNIFQHFTFFQIMWSSKPKWVDEVQN
jgi:hypothetical protein